MNDRRLFALLADQLDQNRNAALATVCSRSGSAPRGVGARMLLLDDGTFHGSVGGGSLEHQVEAAMRATLADGPPARLMTVALDGAQAADDGMICGGSLTVLVERLTPDPELAALVATVGDALARGETASLETTLTNKTIVRIQTGSLPSADSVELSDADGTVVVRQRIVPQPHCLVFGGGHVGRATALLAHQTGFSVLLVDDRPDFADGATYHDDIDVRLRDMTAPMDDLPAAGGFIVIVTRGHAHDGAVLAQALKTEAAYIGMIGSRRKRDMLYDELRRTGVSDERLSAIRCPIGLDIGAQTPEEIAVAVVAEMIQRKAGRG